MHSLHAHQGGCCGKELPGRPGKAASAHDLDAEAKRSHLPKGETARSYDHIYAPFNQSCEEYEYIA